MKHVGSYGLLRPFIKWYTTHLCNARCRHCFLSESSGKDQNTLSKTEAFGMIEKLAELGFQVLSFGGAEPTMQEGLIDIIEFAGNVGLKTKIHTNGLLLSETAAERMRDSGVFEVRISIDGATKSTNDYVRGRESFARVTSVVQMLAKQNVPVTTATAWSQLNISEAVEIVNLSMRLGACRHHSYTLVDKGRGVDMSQFLLNEDQIETLKVSLRDAFPLETKQALLRKSENLPCRKFKVPYFEIKNHGDLYVYSDSKASWGIGVEMIGNILHDNAKDVIDGWCKANLDRIPVCQKCAYFATAWCIELDNYCVMDVDLLPPSKGEQYAQNRPDSLVESPIPNNNRQV